MRTINRRYAAPVLLLLAGSAALLAQEAPKPAEPKAPPATAAPAAAAPAGQTPTFPAQVEQVIVDVVVTDKKGKPIRGLTKSDLTVTEDGAAQGIVTFEAVELPEQPAPVAPPPPRVSTNSAPAEQRGRTFVIVFDDVHLTPFKAREAKAAVASFLEKGVREGDRVTLVSTAGGTWWTARMEWGRPKLLDLVKQFDGRYIPDTSPERMSDWEAMRIYMYHDPLVVERVSRRFETYGVGAMIDRSRRQSTPLAGTTDDPYVNGRASEVYFQAANRNRITLDVLERVLNGLVDTKGRKSVLLVSEGFIYDPNLDEFKRVNAASRRANAAIYFVNARGLEGVPLNMTAQFGPALPEQDVGFAFAETLDAVGGSDSVAYDSGGFVVRNTNDLSTGIQKIADETRVYYLLGYNPSNTNRDGKFRKIQVKLAEGKGREVRARKGYYAPSDEAKTALTARKPGVDPVIQAALDSPWAEDAIPLRMTDYVGEEKMLGKAAVVVVTEMDIRTLGFEEKEGRHYADVDFLLVVAHRESGEFFRYDQQVNMKLLPATRERLTRLWFPIVRDFELKSGDYQAKIVVRDKRSGRVGTVMHEFEVPALDQFRVSTPLLSDSRQANPEGSAVRLTPLARREFTQGSDLLCEFEVYGAQKDNKTGMPQVTQGYEVRRSDGTVLTRMPPKAIRPTSIGGLSRIFGFKLNPEDATPGEYEIVMSFKDELSGKSLEMREAFRVVPAPAAPAPSAGS
jgi:VWFA-related protein